MPNHLHGIVIINQENDGSYLDNSTDTNVKNLGVYTNAKDLITAKNLGASLAPLRARKPRSLSSFVAGFKSAVTKKVRQICQESDLRLWQRNYYESIIRDQQHLENVRQYIINNPLCWNEDPESQNHQSFDFPF